VFTLMVVMPVSMCIPMEEAEVGTSHIGPGSHRLFLWENEYLTKE